MIDEIGVDIVENERIKERLSTPRLLENILTSAELAQYTNRKGLKRLEYICGRFAAKEAIIKALHPYATPHYLEIEILDDSNGAPTVKYQNYNIKLSISHEKHYTVSTAILLKPC